MKTLLADFRKFISQGNVIQLAVGVMIGASFQTIVKSFTDGFITPLLNLFGGQPDVPLKIWHFDVGMVINAIMGFLITAAIIFFLIVKPMAKFGSVTEAKVDGEAADVKLLKEIRDLLKQQAAVGQETVLESAVLESTPPVAQSRPTLTP